MKKRAEISSFEIVFVLRVLNCFVNLVLLLQLQIYLKRILRIETRQCKLQIYTQMMLLHSLSAGL